MEKKQSDRHMVAAVEISKPLHGLGSQSFESSAVAVTAVFD